MKKYSTFLFQKPSDEIESERILYFTRNIILVTIAIFLLLSVVKLFVPPPNDFSDYISWTLIILLSVYYFILKSGRVNLAGSLYVFTLWLALTYLAWSFDGVKDTAVIGYFILIQIAIYIRWTWLALSVSIMSFFSIWALYFAENKHVIIPNEDTVLNYSIDLSLITIIVITLVYLNAKSFLLYYNRLQKELEERLKAEEKAITNEENFHILFDENPIPTVLSEIPSGKIAFANKKIAALLNMDSKDIIGKTANDLGLLANPDDQIHLTNMISNSGFVDNYELDKELPDGKKGTDLIFMRIVTINSKPYCLTVIYDISDRKRAELELSKARDHAEESDRLKSAFLTNMSHEIRTPMNGILGFSELLKEPGLTGEDQQEYLSIIEKSGVRMLNIINDLVDISKIEAGQMKVSVSETNVNEQLDYIYNFFKPEAELKGLKILQKKFLSEKESLISTDREKLNSVLTNLVKNAVKFTENGTIEFGYEIVVETHNNASLLQFYVKDTGIGIPRDRHTAIFDRFVQADIEDKRAFQGAGLGLSISKAFVEMLGGKIWVESSEGQGSIFYFSIPYLPLLQEDGMLLNHTAVTGTINHHKDLKILIVEDDLVSELVINRIVKSISSNILIARSGDEAVDSCRNNLDIDLVLMDIKMPGIDGYEATQQIRQFNKSVIIVAQTAFALLGDKEKAIGAGCNDYITKPIRSELLLSIVNKHLSTVI